MSSRYVRQKARGWIVPAAAAAGVPFVETINETNDPGAAPVWLTLEFDVFDKSTETYCGFTTEKGTITIAVNATAGSGDDAAIVAVEAAADSFFRQVDTSGRLVLVEQSAPDEFVSNDGSPDYWVSIDIDYEYYV